ncbi:inhibitor of apoptosis-promoting Bax1 [Segatella baroniae F0067]|uniref:Inhibitor of apoptosis-promoting Bax1 n=1 Tax=Segatella baroniae F0067 TaxID=1115809 RepID=U2P955_9BACT|nr:Bax inhibitor-1/YccA family protein [Segatella baroniae]ERK40239.1 inhibitor of apoptosis-promoting Bax1 [Segatella baroniae F0067]
MEVKELEKMIREQEGSLSLAFPALMRKVYVWMALALALTGLTAYGIADNTNLAFTLIGNRALFWGIAIAEFALVMFLTARIRKMSLTTATLSFLLYSVLNGVTMSVIFLAFTASSIATTFYITAGTFGIMAFYGYVTKADLSKLGSILRMALLGLIVALVVNIFMRNSMFDLVISAVGVLIFTGLTAYDSQKIKTALAMQEHPDETAQKVALLGALTLYLDFINLFIYLLRFFGRSNN